MSHIRILGLAMMAVFALSAVAASSAMAELPEFSSAHGFPVKYTGTSGPGTLATVGKHVISCTSDEVTGEVVNFHLLHLTILFKNCKSVSTGVQCNSAGQPAGSIKTVALTAILLYVNRSTKQAGLQAKAESGEVLAEFECTSFEKVKIKGTQNVTITPVNTSTTNFTVTTALSGGKQIPAALENEAGTKFTALQETKGEGIENFGFEESATEGKDSLQFAQAVELKA